MKLWQWMTVCLALAVAMGCATAPPPAPAVEEVQEEVDLTVWIDMAPFNIEGRGWDDADLGHRWDRLPARAEAMVRGPVWTLSHHTAGFAIPFECDSPKIQARWTSRTPFLDMDHMTNTGEAGLDLYAMDGDTLRWCGVGRAPRDPSNEKELVPCAPEGMTQYMLYLPLYNGIETLELGIEPGSTIRSLPHRDTRPICFYGTSITQGGCASRPGMAYPSILGRRLNRETINLGFSGNGRMDLEVADLMADIDAEIFVLDCFANMNIELVNANMLEFIRRLRASHPNTPIVIIEMAVYQDYWFNADRRAEIDEENALTRAYYEQLVEEGMTGLIYLESAGMIGDDSAGTVDGIHSTDLGFVRMADSLEPVLRELLGE